MLFGFSFSCHFFLWAERQVKDSRRSGLSFYFHPKLSLFINVKLVIAVHEWKGETLHAERESYSIDSPFFAFPSYIW